MGLTDVIDEVRQGGEEQAQELLEAARAEAERLVAEATDRAGTYRATRMAQAERDAQAARDQETSHAEFEARKYLLEAEAELRSELRDRLHKGFLRLPAAIRERHLKALLDSAQEIIPTGKVFFAEKDKDVLPKKDGYTRGKAIDIIGGIVVESKDGKIRLDLSYETLLADKWRDILRSESGLFS